MNLVEAQEQLQDVLSAHFNMNERWMTTDSDQVIDEIIKNLLPQWRQEEAVVQAENQVNAFLPFKYVIPKQDLKLLDSITSLLIAAAGANYFMTELHFDPHKGIASAITGIFITILQLGNKLKLATHLEPFEYEIITVLHKNNSIGYSEAELLPLLNMNFDLVTTEYIIQSLNKMGAYPTISGAKAILVWKDTGGRWHTNI